MEPSLVKLPGAPTYDEALAALTTAIHTFTNAAQSAGTKPIRSIIYRAKRTKNGFHIKLVRITFFKDSRCGHGAFVSTKQPVRSEGAEIAYH